MPEALVLAFGDLPPHYKLRFLPVTASERQPAR